MKKINNLYILASCIIVSLTVQLLIACGNVVPNTAHPQNKVQSPIATPTLITIFAEVNIDMAKITPKVTLVKNNSSSSPLVPALTPSPSLTPTSTPSPTLTSTPSATLTPSATSTPTPTLTPTPTPTKFIIPTASGTFPPGPKALYAENKHDGKVTFWAVSPSNPAYRLPLTIGEDSNAFGINAVLSPNRQIIAFTSLAPLGGYRTAANLWIAPIDGSEPQVLAGGVDIGGGFNYPAWSPDNRFIAFVRSVTTDWTYETSVWIVEVATGNETLISTPNAWPLGWTNDSSGVYYRYTANRQSSIQLFSLAKNQSTLVKTLALRTNWCLLAPNSTAYVCRELVNKETAQYNLNFISLTTKTQQTIIDSRFIVRGENHFKALWYPDSQGITIESTVEEGGSIQFIALDADTMQFNKKVLPLAYSDDYIPRSWSPDGNWLAAQRNSSPGGDLYFFANNNKTITYLPTEGATEIVGWLLLDLP